MSFKYIILYFSLVFIFFIPVFYNPSYITQRDNDLGRTYIPQSSFLKDSIINYKQIPLWRPDQLMGETFIGNPLSNLLYPGNILYIFFDVDFAAIIFYIIHFLLAGIFMFLLSKSFKYSDISSFAAGLFYMFSTKMFVHFAAGHITMIVAFSFFPLLFLSFRKIILYSSSKWIIIGAASLVFIYINYPTIAYYSLLFIGIYFFYEIIFNKNKLKTFSFFQIIGVLILTVCLISIVLLPHLEFLKLSTRSQLSLSDVALPLWNFKKFISALIFPYLNLQKLDHESFLYLGLMPLLLSIIGFTKLKLSKKIFLITIGVLTLLFVAGLSTPLFKLAYEYLPALKYSRITTRLWFTVALVSALLSAKAVEKINKKIIIFIIIIFLSETFLIGYLFIQKTPYLSNNDEKIYKLISQDKDLFRVYCTTNCFNPQLIKKFKIETLHGETPLQNLAFINFLSSAGNYNYQNFAVIFPPYQIWQQKSPPIPSAYLLGQANVKYIESTYPINTDDFVYKSKINEVYLYKNALYKPRAYFENSSEEVKITKYTPNYVKIEFAKSDQLRNLIIADNDYPGWFGYIDYKKYNIEKHNEIFRKITIPKNSSIVELKYQPESFKIGKTITIFTIIGLILFYLKKRSHI